MREAWSPDDTDDELDDHRWGRAESFRVGRPRRRWTTWALGLLLILVVVGALGVVWFRHQINPGKSGAPVAVTIPAGASTNQIASILGHAGVIHSPTAFRLYIKVQGTAALLPGNYHLAKNSSYDSAISLLEKGPPIVLQRITIPEGFTLAQIAARVGAMPGRSADKFLAAASSGQVHSNYQPAGGSLEGLLFPATYQVKADEDETSILRRMVTTFDENAASAGLDQAATQLGITPYQVVIVASMVERESKLPEDRGPIASVIYNRLQKKIVLQIDATLLYGQGTTDPHKIDTKADNPYNTYKYKGLPPTPIASPGLPSLQAAANPPTTDFLYYVLSDSNGKHAFTNNAKDFAKLEAQAKAKGLL